MTGPSGEPLPARQPTTDSRWVESAIPTISASGAPSRQAAIASSTLVQMRSASCSTHPGRGDEIPIEALPPRTNRPSAPMRAAFEFVVPWSIAKIN
jgi:hypothetical protein